MADHTIVSIEGIELVGQVRGKALEVSRIQNMQDSATVEDDSLYGTDDEIDISIIEMRNGGKVSVASWRISKSNGNYRSKVSNICRYRGHCGVLRRGKTQ